MIHYRKRTWMILLGLFVAVFTFTFLTGKIKDNKAAQAANALAFNPGYIISDWQMTNYNSMSEAEIQDFLTSKNPCGNQDRGQYDRLTQSYSDRSWHWEGNHFVCLSQERFDGVNIGSGETAAHIIWQAAQDYRINPQALIVLLEKESSLITDPIPNTKDYKTATGFACPDTGPCDPARMGLKNQIRLAAELYREVMDGGWTNYPVGNNYIQYNPNKACGGTIVNIQNRATSALYRYTPYQPNASALAAGYGAGDGCGAYGNRNFYLLFEDWFGGITKGADSYKEAATSYQRTVEDGIYQIIPKSEKSNTIDIKGGTTNLITWERRDSNNANQVFEIKYDSSNGYYSITNPATGEAMDVRSNITDNRAPVDVYPAHTGSNQDWLFTKNSDGYYTITSRISSRVMDVRKGDEIILYDSHGGDNQRWELKRIDGGGSDKKISGVYRFISKKYPTEVLDIEGGVKNDKGALISWEKRNDNFLNQVFEIRYDKTDGYYNLINPTNGSAIDVTSKGTTNLTPVGVWPLHSQCNQDFEIIEDNGYYGFRSACSDKVLDIDGATKHLIIYDSHGGDNQRWKLEKVY